MKIRNAVVHEARGIEPFDEHFAPRGGALAGVVAAVAMGLAMTIVEPAVLRESIAGLYGLSGDMAAGWIAHLFHGAIFGVAFAAVMADPSLVGVRDWLWKSTVAGILFGVILAVVGMGIIMPMWLSAGGLSAAPDPPFVTASLLGWHLVFGAVLGATFPFVDEA